MLKKRKKYLMLSNRNLSYFFMVLTWIFAAQFASGAMAATINVSPGESLQAAIDGASSGDTIQLESGIYRTADDAPDDEITIDKDLTIIGAGRDSTFIQAADSKNTAGHGVFSIGFAEVTLRDLTVRYGKVTDDVGGGIFHISGALTLENCAVRDNIIVGDDIYGAGLFAGLVEVIIKDSIFSGNMATGGSSDPAEGGGLDVDSGTLSMSGSTVSGNTAAGPGGGMYLYYTTADISDCIITQNTTDLDGGGLFGDGCLITISNTSITENTSNNTNFGGGGIFNYATNLTITNSRIRGNTANYEGGGLYNFEGSVTISESTITGNRVVTDDGGGIKNYDTMYIFKSTISGNDAFESGGGIHNNALMHLENSTVSGNSAGHGGGGIKNYDSVIHISNSTISGNTADTVGGGLYNETSQGSISFSTITENTSGANGGGIFNDSFLKVGDTIVAGNAAQASGPDRGTDYYNDSTYTESSGGNLIGTNNGFQTSTAFPAGSPNANGDYVGEDGGTIDPLLLTLADNGGPTMTHALSSTASPAVDKALGDIDTDQRGYGRPYPSGGSRDIGAFEYFGSADLALTKTVDNATPNVDDRIVYTITLKNNGPDQASGVTVTETLPDDLIFLTDDSGGDFDSDSGVWTVGALASGASEILNLRFLVNTGDEVINTVSAASETTDSSPASASAIINDSGSNSPPIARDQEVTTPLNTPVDITLVATDEDQEPLTYSIVDAPANGSLVSTTLGSGGNTVTYAPNTGVGGTDRFTFKANDGTVDSNTAVVEITIGDVSQFYTLTVDKDGDADGRVNAFPVGIDCGNVCSDTLTQGTHVRLTATPDDGAAFDGWTGTDCPGNGDCSLILNVGLTVTATFNTDSDGDGVSDVVEDAGPNDGDANKDGIKDSTQAGIASFSGINGDNVFLEAEEGKSFSDVKALTNPSKDAALDPFEFPTGFFTFQVNGLEEGGSTVVILHQPLNQSLITYFKFGSTPDNQTDHWYPFLWEDGSGTGATISHDDETRIVFHFVDGERGDSDVILNSVIVDPGAPASVNESGGGGGGGGCSCGGSAGASINGRPSKGDFDLGLLLAALAGLMMVAWRRRWSKI